MYISQHKYPWINIFLVIVVSLISVSVIYYGNVLNQPSQHSLTIFVITINTYLLISYKNSLTYRAKYLLNKEVQEANILIDTYIPTSRTDLSGNITHINSAMSALTGYSKEELVGKSHRILRDKTEDTDKYKHMWEQITKGKIWQGEVKNRTKSGKLYYVNAHVHPIFDETNKIIGYQALREDITDKKELEFLSSHDKLTNIYNRSKFDELLEYELERYSRYNKIFSLAMLDLDFFKNVNDTYGHQVGDRVLVQIVQIIKNEIRESDVLARWGGEEFTLLFPYTNKNEAKIVIEKIRIAIEKHSFELIGTLTISCGLSEIVEKDTAFSIIQRIDSALYEAKESGRNKIVIF